MKPHRSLTVVLAHALGLACVAQQPFPSASQLRADGSVEHSFTLSQADTQARAIGSSSTDSLDLDLPNAPEPTAPSRVSTSPVPLSIANSRLQKKAPAERVVTPKFWVINSAGLGMTFLDYFTTQHCIHKNTCREGNPLMPQSAVGMALVGGGTNAVSIWISYHQKKSKSKLWVEPPIMQIASHTVGFISGVRFW